MNNDKIITRSKKGVPLFPLLQHHPASLRPTLKSKMGEHEQLMQALTALTASIQLQNDNHAEITLNQTNRQNAQMRKPCWAVGS